jgi:hypothetical protein
VNAWPWRPGWHSAKPRMAKREAWCRPNGSTDGDAATTALANAIADMFGETAARRDGRGVAAEWPADGEVVISICAAYHYFQWMRGTPLAGVTVRLKTDALKTNLNLC